VAQQQNGVALSAPVTPATTPVAPKNFVIKEGLFEERCYCT